MGTPCCWQNAAASRNSRAVGRGGRMPVGGARGRVSRPLPKGEPLMMPMLFCRASGSSSSSARVVQAVVIVDQPGIDVVVA